MLSFLISSAKLLAIWDDGSGAGLQTPTYAPAAPSGWMNGCLFNSNTAKDVATLSCIPSMVSLVINFIFGLAAVVAVIFILLSGIKFLTSGGDPKQVEGARKTLTFAIIGLIVILLSFAIINLIAFLFMPDNIKCLTTFSLLTNSPCK